MWTFLRRFLQWKLVSLTRYKLSLEHPLEYLFLEVTRRCNLSCRYCGSLCTSKAQGEEMESEKWLEVLEHIAQNYRPDKIMVAVTGGEALLKEGIFDIFRKLHELGFPYGMVSNGMLLDEKAAREIVQSGMGSISLSLDGPEEVNDELRGKGSFAGVKRAVDNLREAGFGGILEIMSTVTKPVVPHLETMRQVVLEMGVKQWRVVPVMPIGRAALDKELIIDEGDLKKILLFAEKGRADGVMPLVEFGEEGYLGDRFEGVVRPALHMCRAGLNVAGIMANGKIGACPELPESFLQGDLACDDFVDVWENRYEVFRDRSWARKDQCLNCDSWSRCHGGSLHLYDKPGGDFCRCSYLMLNKEVEGSE